MLNANSFRDFMNPERAEAYRRLREGPPIFKSAKDAAWVLTRYADVSSILRHPSAQAIEYGQFFCELDKRGNLGLSQLRTGCLTIPLFQRPPLHDHIRRIIAQLLGNFRRTGLPETLSERVDSILSSGHAKGQIELVREFGREIALCSIATILGLPPHELQQLIDDGRDLVLLFDRFPPSLARLRKLNHAGEFVLGYFKDAIAGRRADTTPGADGLSLLMRQAEDTGVCSDEDIAGFCSFFLFAGVLTTAAALSDCALCLLSDSSLRERLKEDSSLLPSFAREVLRLSSPVKYISREMRDDTEIAGTAVRAGDHVVLMLDVANRDSEVYPDPDVLDLGREGPEPLTFAAGPYRCLGGQLATFEVELAAKKLLEWPSLHWTPHPLGWEENANIAGLRYLNGLYKDEGGYGGE